MIRRTALLAAVLLAVVAMPAVAAHTFDDVTDDNVFHRDIAWLEATGITRGCNPPANTRFCPDDDVSREQLAAFLRRANAYQLDQHAAGDPGALARRLAAVNRATAAYQDVPLAVEDGYLDTTDSLGCHENPAIGGMGVHYLDEDLLDGTVRATEPEALVYELDADGEVTGLVALEYLVPIDAWSSPNPPELFGQPFTQHPVLPFWKLHAWIWKDNPIGTFQDFNPKVRLCPDGVPVFGED